MELRALPSNRAALSSVSPCNDEMELDSVRAKSTKTFAGTRWMIGQKQHRVLHAHQSFVTRSSTFLLDDTTVSFRQTPKLAFRAVDRSQVLRSVSPDRPSLAVKHAK